MKKFTVLSGIIFLFFITIRNYVQAGTAESGAQTIISVKNTHPVNYNRENSVIEGYYVSEPMDGETENCSLSVKIEKVQGQYIYVFNIGGKIEKGKVKLTKADDPNEVGMIFKGIKWAENNGDVSRTGRRVTLKLPDGIEGIWSASGIMIQNYGNAMNNYVQIAACGQKYINLVKQ